MNQVRLRRRGRISNGSLAIKASAWVAFAAAACATRGDDRAAPRDDVPASLPATREAADTSAGTGAAPEPAPAPSLFRDPDDGAFDVSRFLDGRTGFLPIAHPVTEPAVGYGLAGGLAFFHTRPQVLQTPDGPRVLPPNVTAVGGLGTENDSWAVFAAHLHTWHQGRVRYVAGGGYASLNLDWFGRGDAFDGRSFAYNIEAFALIQKLTFKLGDSDFFAGPTQRLIDTHSTFDGDGDLPRPGGEFGIRPDQLDATASGVGATIGYDTRDSLFSPTRGTKAAVSYTHNLEGIGSDFDYGRLDAEVCQYVPLGGPFTLGLRVASTYSGDDAPFFDLGSVALRGIQAGRYVGNAALTAEAELRWDVTRRWTLVGFAGSGWVASDFAGLFDDDAHPAAGAGFRYLVAREYDLRLGLDLARGEDDTAVYVTLGTGWLRD